MRHINRPTSILTTARLDPSPRRFSPAAPPERKISHPARKPAPRAPIRHTTPQLFNRFFRQPFVQKDATVTEGFAPMNTENFTERNGHARPFISGFHGPIPLFAPLSYVSNLLAPGAHWSQSPMFYGYAYTRFVPFSPAIYLRVRSSPEQRRCGRPRRTRRR